MERRIVIKNIVLVLEHVTIKNLLGSIWGGCGQWVVGFSREFEDHGHRRDQGIHFSGECLGYYSLNIGHLVNK